jgi:DNA-binding CsgD family transcriptional regulator
MESKLNPLLNELEKIWQSSFVSTEELYDSLLLLKKHARANHKNFIVFTALTEVMLLRQANRQSDADALERQYSNSFSRIANPLYKHRWKRIQLIESFRTGNKKAELSSVLHLIEEAEQNGWIEEQLRALFLKHIVEKFSGHFSAALATAQQVKLLATQHNHTYYKLQSAWSVPHIYHFFGEKKRAYEECVRVEKLFKNDYSQAINRNYYVLLADCYAAFEEYDKALKIYGQLLNYFNQSTLPDHAVQLSVLINTAYVCEQKKDLKKAETYLTEAHKIASKVNQPMYALGALLGLAELYHKTSRYSEMKKIIVAAEKVSVLVKAAVYEVKLLELKALYQQAEGTPKHALVAYQTYHKRFAQWKEIDNEEKLKALDNRHQLELQELKQQIMKKEMEHLQQELQLLNANVEQKSKLIKQFAIYFNELEQTAIRRKEIFVKLREMVNTVEHAPQTDNAGYSAKFNEVHREAMYKLHTAFPAITNAEAGVAVMLTKGLSNKDIASLTLTTVRSVEKHRLQLRKKMQLKREDDLVKQITGIISR